VTLCRGRSMSGDSLEARPIEAPDSTSNRRPSSTPSGDLERRGPFSECCLISLRLDARKLPDEEDNLLVSL
jgi:hypothetical protein